MEGFIVQKKQVEQVQVICEVCSEQAVSLHQQNYWHPEKPNNVIIACHNCKKAIIVEEVEFDKMVKGA